MPTDADMYAGLDVQVECEHQLALERSHREELVRQKAAAEQRTLTVEAAAAALEVGGPGVGAMLSNRHLSAVTKKASCSRPTEMYGRVC